MIDNWIVHNFDRIVRSSGADGMKLADAKLAVAERVTEAIATGEYQPTVSEIAEALVDRDVTPERRRRSRALSHEVEYIISALNGETILGADDPKLWVAYPLGDGRDKVLALWTADDWKSSRQVRGEKVADAIAADQIYGELVDQVVSAMVAANASTTVDLATQTAA